MYTKGEQNKLPQNVPLWHVDCFSSVQFSRSVVSDSLRPHGLQHARPPCPSPTPGAYSNSCPLNQWCHPTISSSVIPFSSRLQYFPTSGSFLVSQFFNTQPSLWFSSHIHTWLLENPYLWLIQTFVSKVMSLLFNMLSRFVKCRNPIKLLVWIKWHT